MYPLTPSATFVKVISGSGDKLAIEFLLLISFSERGNLYNDIISFKLIDIEQMTMLFDSLSLKVIPRKILSLCKMLVVVDVSLST